MGSLLGIAILGILASFATEAVTWLNKKWSGTVLQGKGAFVLAIILSFLIATAKVLFISHVELSWTTLGVVWSQIFAVSQVFFVLIVKWLGMDVKEER